MASSKSVIHGALRNHHKALAAALGENLESFTLRLTALAERFRYLPRRELSQFVNNLVCSGYLRDPEARLWLDLGGWDVGSQAGPKTFTLKVGMVSVMPGIHKPLMLYPLLDLELVNKHCTLKSLPRKLVSLYSGSGGHTKLWNRVTSKGTMTPSECRSVVAELLSLLSLAMGSRDIQSWTVVIHTPKILNHYQLDTHLDTLVAYYAPTPAVLEEYLKAKTQGLKLSEETETLHVVLSRLGLRRVRRSGMALPRQSSAFSPTSRPPEPTPDQPTAEEPEEEEESVAATTTTEDDEKHTDDAWTMLGFQPVEADDAISTVMCAAVKPEPRRTPPVFCAESVDFKLKEAKSRLKDLAHGLEVLFEQVKTLRLLLQECSAEASRTESFSSAHKTE